MSRAAQHRNLQDTSTECYPFPGPFATDVIRTFLSGLFLDDPNSVRLTALTGGHASLLAQFGFLPFGSGGLRSDCGFRALL